MKRLLAFLVLIVTIMTLTSCEQENYYVREDNELYSDPHIGLGAYSRSYSMYYILMDHINVQPAKDKSLSEMKRVVFTDVGENTQGILYVLDTHSKRIYCGNNMNFANVFQCEYVVDLNQSDIDRLVSKLMTLEVQRWKEKKNNNAGGSEYQIGIEYDDGSVERHYIKGKDDSINALLSYFESERATFKNRMLSDRKTTANIDYLISYLGWDPSRESAEPFNVLRPVPLLEVPPLDIEKIERIVLFEAEEPHDVLDHSRNKQKTLFLDILNGQIYYEPETAIYEKIYNASVIRDIADGEAESVISVLSENVAEWKANELYLTNDEARGFKPSYVDIHAWSIGIQYSDGTIVHFSGDGIGAGGWAPGAREVLDALFAAIDRD